MAIRARDIGHWEFGDNTPIVADIPDVQTTLPTSAYGQTIPVVYGKARLPAAYIWCAPILTITSTHQHYWDTITTTTSKMTCRLRFARPLVPDSNWSLRRLWANGKLYYDGSTGYRAKGLKFRFYAGLSTQGRDSAMVSEEGTTNVSAHRGYIDLVLENFDIVGFGAPPAFEAEVVQDGATVADVDSFQTFFSDQIGTIAALDPDTNQFYGYGSGYIRRFNIGALREVYAIPLALGSYHFVAERSLRYIPEINKLVALMAPSAGYPWYCVLIDPETGLITVESSDGSGSAGATDPVQATCHIRMANSSLYLVSHFSDRLGIFTISGTENERVYLSGGNWSGYSDVRCITAGTITGDNVEVWVCADNKLVKLVINLHGLILTQTEIATTTDDLVYALWHDGGVIVWSDNNQAMRINATTGVAEWTKTVPYQLSSTPSLQAVNPADANVFVDELFVQTTAHYYFTDLDTGLTRDVAKGSATVYRNIYDGNSKTVITTDNLVRPVRTLFDGSGDGTQRNLSDFLTALFEAGGYDSDEIETVNIDDLIDGAVIDVTGGVREIARSVCEPYSIAIYERAGTIILKRAYTDGAFVVDATLSSSGDIADSGGQAIKAKKGNPEEFISRYGINYRDPAEVYQARPQYGEIPTLPFPVAVSDQSVKANVPIIVDADTIKTLATQKVNRLAIEKHEFSQSLRAKFSDLEPEDVLQFTFASRTITARILETTLRPDYVLDIVATEFLSGVAVTISGGTGTPIEPSPVGTPASRYYHLDIPLLADSDDLQSLGLVQYHVLASAGQPYWDGATLFRADGTGAYQPVAQQLENGIVGIALEALPDWDIPYVTEFYRTLDVAFLSGDPTTLASATYLEMVNGANFFAIGQPGRWEVCQVMTITSNADGSYTFEGLRRGRKSSEEYTALHAQGDYVVWLSGDNVQELDYALASLNVSQSFKPVGFGGSLATTIAVAATIAGEAEKIPKPCHLDASIDSPSDVRLSWVRRSRIGAFWADDGDDSYTVPLGETLEQYVVRIKDGPDGTVLRTVTVDDATLYDYSGVLQTTDFGSPLTSGDDLTFDVRQVSGTGVICPAREETITL